MNAPAPVSLCHRTQQRYRDNFARHILGVSRYLQSEIMTALSLKHGHRKLRINYEPYIAMAAEQGVRLSEVAGMLGISRQAANQVADQLATAGYLKRAPDPRDGRAKLLRVTPRARALIRQGTAEAESMQQRCADITGKRKLKRISGTLVILNRQLGLSFAHDDRAGAALAASLPRLADYISQRLQDLTTASGHTGLKRSFATVLTSIGPHGGRIQQIAIAHDVSKQAIGAIVSELEALGYITRLADPNDARQVVLRFTESGQQLIADSVAAVDTLYLELASLTGNTALEELCTGMADIYRGFGLEQDIFRDKSAATLEQMAITIKQQLGDERAVALARLLLPESVNDTGDYG